MSDRSLHPALNRIVDLQTWRGRKAFDPSIAGMVSSVADQAQRTQRRLGELAELWQELVPAEIALHSALVGLRSGVLNVLADSSSAAFELDRLLRSGLEAELRNRYRGTLTRVRVRAGSPQDGASPREHEVRGQVSAGKTKPRLKPKARGFPTGGRPRSRR